MSAPALRFVWWDGETLALEERAGARRLGIDPRCVDGRPVAGAWAHVCASADPEARLPYDMPEVQEARREALRSWIGLLGARLVCLSTLSLDSVHVAGAVTAITGPPELFAWDPFARLFAGTVIQTDLLCPVDPPVGPVIERYAGAPWPAGRFSARP